MSIDKGDCYMYATVTAIAVLLIAVLAVGIIKMRQEMYGPLEAGLCPVKVVLPLPRGGEIRYHAELSCAELDAMARKKEAAHESGD